MDRQDQRILARLQADGRASAAEIGDEIGLSVSATHRRIKQLEDNGVIERYAAVLNRRAIGYTTDFYVEISLQSQSEKVLASFEAAVKDSPDIIECHLVTGASDYLLRVATRGPEDYERVHRQSLAALPGVMRMQSSLVLRTVRPWKGYYL